MRLPGYIRALPAALLAWLATPQARASGLDAPVIGHGQSSPSARDAAAIYWNPAQLAFVRRSEVYFGGAALYVGIGYTRRRLGDYQTSDSLYYTADAANAAGAIDPARSGEAPPVRSGLPVAATGNLFFAIPVHERVTLGGGLYVPSAAILALPQDGAQKFQVQEAVILASKATLGLGVKATDYLSFGAGLSYVLGFAELSRMQDFAAVNELGSGLEGLGQDNDFGADAPSEVRELDVFARPFALKSAFAHMVTFNAGIAAQPTEKFGINLAYEHSSPLTFKGRVVMDMDEPFFTSDLEDQGVKFPTLLRGQATLKPLLPKRLTLGAAYDISERYRVDGFVQLSLYGQVESFDVELSSPDLEQPALGIGDTVQVKLDRDWKHTVWVEGNFRMQLNDRLLGSASLGYMSPASPDRTVDLASIDGHRLLGGVGLALDINQKWSLLGDLRAQGILPRTVTDSDYDLGNGTYRLVIASLGLHARARF